MLILIFLAPEFSVTSSFDYIFQDQTRIMRMGYMKINIYIFILLVATSLIKPGIGLKSVTNKSPSVAIYFFCRIQFFHFDIAP